MSRFLNALTVIAVSVWLGFGQAHAEPKGTFVGASSHVTEGTASVEKSSSGFVIRLHADFWFDGAPDPWVSLGKGDTLNAVQIATLRERSGEQVYKIPLGIDPAEYDKVVIYCVKFTVPLGIAVLEP